MVRGGAHAMGVRSVLEYFEINRNIKIKTDAAAAKSMSNRRE